MRPVIELQGVWKRYRMGEVEVQALRGVNLTIHQGEFVAVMGPSGSGKSTAVNMIGCLDIPTKGTILLDGRNIAHMSESELAQVRGAKIGFVFQQFNLIPTLSALENVTLPTMFQHKKNTHRARELLTLLGLGDRLHHLPMELSGGQQQRVAIARALANDPQVILADEPTGNLDSQTGEEVMQVLSALHKTQKKTIVMVTHDARLAQHADRVAYLKDGQVVSSL